MANSQIRGGQIGPLDLTTEVTGILPVANGGTGVSGSAASAVVATSENTTSTTYADLTTTTDQVTVIIGASGMANVFITSFVLNNGSTNNSIFFGFAMSGANTVAASDTLCFSTNGFTCPGTYSASFILTGLASGSTTFKMKYKVQGNTGTYSNRRIAAIPL
jgi:hypothetical protein